MRRTQVGSFVSLLPAVVIAAVIGAPVSAQPFNAWAVSDGFPELGSVQIPHSSALNPTTGFTFEAWILITGPASTCDTIAGKGFKETWWVGFCNHLGLGLILRSYLRGEFSLFDAGTLPTGQWTHIAITWDSASATRRHYINGEEVGSLATPGPLPTNTRAVGLLSDFFWDKAPHGTLDEVRLWNVRRTQEQIRDKINVRIDTAMPGLVAVWPLDGNGNDVIGPRDGVVTGSGIHFLNGPVASNCGSQTDTHFCLATRFSASARFRVGPPGALEQQAMTVPCAGGGLCNNSGIFWFFQVENWELMLKVLNGCGITHHWWVFNAGLTNVFFRLEVTDVMSANTKIYFNYPGPPAPAIADTSAFAVCPP
jgi:hypothetical protein